MVVPSGTKSDSTLKYEAQDSDLGIQDVLANWPEDVQYLTKPIASPYLTQSQRKWLTRRPHEQGDTTTEILPVIALPLRKADVDGRIGIRLIQDDRHPAHGQRGLFASRDFAPGDLIIPYIGYVHSSTESEQSVYSSTVSQHDVQGASIGKWESSSYDLNLYRDEGIELAIDAAEQGNEARFCNDYRGVPSQDTVLHTSSTWNRSSKRNVRTPNSDFGTISRSQSRSNGSIENAIPNAEFRDVWLLLPPEDSTNDQSRQSGSEGMIDPTFRPMFTSDRTNEKRSKPPEDEQSKSNKQVTDKQQRRQQRRKQTGMRGVAIFVLPAGKGGKRKYGIKNGQEILVSYGKGFWAHHQTPSNSTNVQD